MKRKKIKSNQLTFSEHARELRLRLFFSFLSLVVCFFIIFYFSDQLIDFISRPLAGLGYDLHFIKVQEAFFSIIKASFFSALIVSSPLWLALIIGFIVPALKKTEIVLFIVIFVFSLLLIAAGFIFSYKILIPISLNYLLSFAKDKYVSVISIEFYLNYFLVMFFATGVGFQLPLIMLFLSKTGVLDYQALKKARKYAFLVLLIISAGLTPPDIISQVILGLPLYILYEIGLILVFIFTGRREEKT